MERRIFARADSYGINYFIAENVIKIVLPLLPINIDMNFSQKDFLNYKKKEKINFISHRTSSLIIKCFNGAIFVHN